ncbi:hypothetical protein I6N90_17210 [Paenibacillus sp. GSMTC-2017]|uniref:hypothetical protein n=1 Tax=Paenibacillus sp. GSMTC-2017 TaxID=2794350 RepID=UPI0018D829CD|nr:hypothetical protein [Paenibacillus sp. GSMTC-2017]MBH5319538.1 hypothetical protein [Paenibacillus sp. GSMTC-2017]
MASSDAKKTIDVMTSKHWHNVVAPRALLEMMRYKPSNSAHLIKIPVLVSMAAYFLYWFLWRHTIKKRLVT